MDDPPIEAGGDEPKPDLPSEPAVGLEFDSADLARTFYCDYADRVGFRVRNSKSFTSRVDETVIMRRFVCSKQGLPTKKDPFDISKKRRNRVSSREGCKAMFQVNRRENGRWVASRCVIEHCHPLGISPKQSDAVLKKLAKKPWELIIGSPVVEPQQNGLGPGGGVLQSLLEYFKRMQADNPAFFYACQLDSNNCVMNVFWADARARMAYTYFGDTVRIDLTCKINKRVVPFAAFTGFNHHREVIVFGCAFITDESVDSFSWLFETWLMAMKEQYPTSAVTSLDETTCAAVEAVFPNATHRICQHDVFSKCKEKLADVYTSHASFKREFKDTVNESDTVGQFELNWSQLLAKYSIEDNIWLQQLYNIRHKWVPVYLRNSFFAEINPAKKSENMNKFFQRNSITTTTLRDIVEQFDKAMISQYENELQADFSALQTRPVMKTPSPLEQQAANIYTRAAFDVFQRELVESSGFLMEKIDDSLVSRFRLTKVENATVAHIVTFISSDKMINCSCCKFEFSGILCRHILRVCLVVGLLMIPQNYILKRWTKDAKSNNVLVGNHHSSLSRDCPKSLAWRCNDLCRDAIKLAEEGATSEEIYKIAKAVIQKALTEVFASKTYISANWTGR